MKFALVNIGSDPDPLVEVAGNMNMEMYFSVTLALDICFYKY